MTEETQPNIKSKIVIDTTRRLIGVDEEIETDEKKIRGLKILPLDKCTVEVTNTTDKTKNEKAKIAVITCHDPNIKVPVIDPYIIVGAIEAVLYSILEQ